MLGPAPGGVKVGGSDLVPQRWLAWACFGGDQDRWLGPALAGGPAEGTCLVLWRSLTQASSVAIFNVFIISIVMSYISLNKKIYMYIFWFLETGSLCVIPLVEPELPL